MGQLLFFLSKLKLLNGSIAKASFNLQDFKSVKFKKKDPKPSDLCMSKLMFVVIDY